MKFYPESGFAAIGAKRPEIGEPGDWLVWHFTTWGNLRRIVADGCLKPDSEAGPVEGVGDLGIKASRLARHVVPLDQCGTSLYPRGVTVGNHVPFYFAPRSPMLRRVLSNGAQYRGDHSGLVMLGTSIRSVAASGMTWCVSDRNAASPIAQFTRTLDTIGTFIDFDLMKQRMWKNTPEDRDRQNRRAAEFLVLGRMPVAMITHVVVATSQGLITARQELESVGGTRHYERQPCFLYQ